MKYISIILTLMASLATTVYSAAANTKPLSELPVIGRAMVPSDDIVINAGRGAQSPIYSTRFAGSTFPAGWASNGAWTITNALQAPAGGDWNTVAMWDKHTTLDDAVVRATIRLSSTSDQVGVIRYDKTLHWVGAALVMDCAAGKLSLYGPWDCTNAPPCATNVALGFTPVAGRLYLLEMSKTDIGHVAGRVVDSVTGSNAVLSFVSSGWPNNINSPDCPGIVSLSGTPTITSFEYATRSPQSPRLLILGDSLCEGDTISPALDSRYAALMRDKLNGDCVIASLGGENTTTILPRLDTDLDYFTPRYVLCTLVVNDRDFATWTNNIQTIKTRVEAVGAELILATVVPWPPRQTFFNQVNEWILTNGTLRYIDAAYATSLDGYRTNQNPTLFIPFNVHPNVAGNAAIYAQALTDIGDVLEINLSGMAFRSIDIGTDMVWDNNGRIIPWMLPSLGSTVPIGSNGYAVVAAGLDIWGGGDGFRFVYTNVLGDFDMKVRVASLAKADNGTKAGLIAREGTNWGARYFDVFTTPADGVNSCSCECRTDSNGDAVSLGNTGSPYAGTSFPNMWLRLQRTGDAFQGYRSADGVNWLSLGVKNISMTSSICVGLATTAHDYAGAGFVTTAQYRDITVVNGPFPTKYIALSGNLAFGNVIVGGNAQATLTIANTGNSPFKVSNIHYPAGFSGAGSGTIGSDSVQLVTVTFAPSAVGSYGGNLAVISDAYGGNDTYTISGIGIPAPAAVALNASTISPVYDGSPKVVTASTTPPGLVLAITYDGSTTPPTGASNYTVVATVIDPIYIGSASGTLTINKAMPSLVWADPADIAYGMALGANQFNASASVPGSFLYSPLAGTVLSAVDGQLVSVAFTPTDIANYQNATAAVNINVLKASLTVSANNSSRTYGNVNPAFTANISGFVNGETAAVVSGAASAYTSAIANSAVGSYPITPAVGSLSAANYTFANFVNGTMTVTPATLTIRANDRSKTYGQTVTFVGTEFISSGLQNSETVGIVSLASSGAAASVGVIGSPYSIVPSLDVGGTFNPANYTIIRVNGGLTVNPSVLTVSANDKSRAYGMTNPVFAATYSGFVNGENTNVLIGSPGLSTVTDTSSPVGDYPIEIGQGTLANANYVFNFTNGILTITPYALTVSADSTNRVYGAANPILTGTTAGLQNGDIITATYSCAATTNSPAGTYPIVPLLVDPEGKLANYKAVLNNGTLTVNMPVASAPRMTNAKLMSGSFSVSVSTEAGWSYAFEYKNSLIDANWTVLLTLPGNAGTVTFTDNAVTGPSRYYRIRVQ